MNQWRRRTIKLVLALILVLCVLLFSETEAEGVWRQDLEQIEEVEYVDPLYDPHSDHPRVFDIPDNVYYDTLENEIQEDDYFDNDLLLNEEGVEYDPRVGGREYDELNPRPEFSELPHCPDVAAEDGQHGAAVVVSTLDGRVTGLDLDSGAVMWSHQTGRSTKPLLSSSMSKLEVTSGGEWVRLIPSLDGGIFRFDGEGVEALPVTAQNLLHSSFKFNPDTIFTGGKATEVWGMALGSGRIIYICNTSGCKRNRTVDKPAHVLVVRRVTQTVRAVDPKSGDERWNFSVGQHEVNMAGDEGCKAGTGVGAGQDEGDGVSVNNNLTLRFIVPDGVVMGVHDNGQLVWKQKLTSPVVSAWRVSDGVVEEVDLFSTSSVPALTPTHGLPAPQDGDEQPALYVGVHQKQLYIQQSGHMRHRVTHATKVFTAADSGSEDCTEDMDESVKFPRVEWRPYLATAPSRTPVLHHQSPPRTHHPLLGFDEGESDTNLAIMHSADYPFDNGYYLYADPGSGLNLSRPWERPSGGSAAAGGEEEAGDSIINDISSNIIHICFHIGPDMWMQLSVGLACYLLLHYLLLRYLIRHIRHHLTQQALLIAHNIIIILLSNPHILRLIQRMGLQLPALPPAPTPTPSPTPAPAISLPLSFTPSTSSLPPPSERSDSSSLVYTSRYLTDFELVRCLGRGGFGMVFQVRNRLDENEYAVKRIILPAKEKSAERVKREVRALAKLNHTNIVRYYNSWLESPPPGWQDEVDALWKNGDALSTSLLSPSEETNPRDTGVWPEQGREASDASLARAIDQNVAGVGGEVAEDFSFDVVIQDNCALPDVLSKSQDNPFSGGVAFEDMCEKASNCSQDDLSFDILFEDSPQDPRNVSRLSSSKGEDESIEVVFEESQKSSQVSRCKRKSGDDSVDIVFEDSCNSSRVCGHMSSNSDGEEVSSKGLWKTSEWSSTSGYSCSQRSANISSNKCKKSVGNCSGGEDGDSSDYIVFEESNLVNIKHSPVSRSGHSDNTSHPHPIRSQSQEVYSHHLSVGKSKRRRIKSYPALNKHSPKKRPSSLGLPESSINKPSPPIRDDLKCPRDARGEGKGEARGVEGRGDVRGEAGEKDRGEVAKLLNPRTFLYIQMELCQKESLRDWLIRNQTRDKDIVLSIFNDIVKAVEYVHDNHLMHRDLKPSNIFFSLDGEVKIGDFGLVTTIAEEEGGEGEVRTPAAPLPASAVPRTHTHRVGTQLYMSPEQVSGATYDYKVDIFSLGLVLLEMLLPFNTGMERLEVMSRARLSRFPQDFPKRFPDETSLLELMLSADSSCRPTTRGVRARPPLRTLQGPDALRHIHPSHHFHLPRQRPHSSTSTSTSVSSN